MVWSKVEILIGYLAMHKLVCLSTVLADENGATIVKKLGEIITMAMMDKIV